MEQSDSPGVRFPPPFAFAAGLGVGYCLSLWIPTRWLPVEVAGVLGWLLAGLGLALAAAAMLVFRFSGTTIRPDRPATKLAAVGPYRFTRNPMYLSMTLLYAGLAIVWQLLWAILLLPLVVLWIDHRVIQREEQYLERRFGADYTGYKAQVRRWI